MSNEIWIFVINLVVSIIVGVASAFFTIGRYKEKVDTLKDSHTRLEEKSTKMKTNIDQLLEFKTQAQKFIDKNIYKDQSPLSLTEFGQQLVDDSGFKSIFDDIKDDLVHMLEEQAPATQYETQEKARSLMDTLADYGPFQPIQKYAFEHGKDLNQILRAGGILLRDYYFTKHPEVINPNEEY